LFLAPFFQYRIFSWFGILALIQSIVNPATIGPIVFFVGLQVNEEALNFMPSRHYSAYIIGLFPSVYDWVTNVSNRAPLASDDFTYDSNSPGSPSWVGVLAWKRGSLLVSLLWVSMVVQVLDRQWKLASIWAIISSLFAVFGIIHVPEAGFNNFAAPFWEQCTGPDLCWDFAEQWMFFVAYLMLAATFMLIFISSKFDSHIEEPIDDESRHAFDDWFADAYKYKDEHGNIIDARTGALAADIATAAAEAGKEDPDFEKEAAAEEAPAEEETTDASK
jgi:AGZA family xanthine/uracil permease-like MFS transporter